MVRTATRLHRDRTARQLREEPEQLFTPELLPQHNCAVHIRTMHLKNVLRQIQPDCDNLFHGRLLGGLQHHPLWHTDAALGRPPHQSRQPQISCPAQLD
jgi:hypothetical protein